MAATNVQFSYIKVAEERRTTVYVNQIMAIGIVFILLIRDGSD